MSARVAGSLVIRPPPRHEITQLVANDREQPTPKRSALLVIVQASNGLGNNPQDILGQIGGVGVLQAVFASETVNQGRIDLYKLRPRLGITHIADANQQTRPRDRRIAHRGPSL